MSFADEERRWKRIQDMLAAEASGKTLRPAVSQRTLFGIPSTVEQTIERIVAQDEEERRMKRQREKAQTHIEHPLSPLFDARSRVLVLGTMPSPKSREQGFYYGHPQNRFWRVMASLFDEPVATTNERKRDQMLRHHIALWDVLAACDITGASDASISNPIPNDLRRVIDAAPIEALFCTGAKAAELYARLCEADVGMPCVKLPSPSPANAAVSLDELIQAYAAIIPSLHEQSPRTLDVSAVVELEHTIAHAGTSLAELMDRAGLAIAHRIHTRAPHARITLLCGNGNNGGDGWVAGRELAQWGHRVTIVCNRMPEELKAQPARDAARAAHPILSNHAATVLCNPSVAQLKAALHDTDVIVDALLGTGFTGDNVKEPFNRWIEHANACRIDGKHLVAADVPSGLNAQTGTAGDPCITADETITMMVSKPGLGLAGKKRCGQVHIAPLAYIEPFLSPD